jgi:quercetin dioxygenase-like cupin family protein
MRPHLALISGFAAIIVGIIAGGGVAWAQEPKLAPEGRGLLPTPPTATPGPTPAHSFWRDPSGGFSRTIFETDENPDFKLIIRDFSFPPDKQPHTVALRSAAFFHLLSGVGEISISKQRLSLTPVARTSVPAGAPIEVVNNGEQPVVVRALIVESKWPCALFSAQSPP